MHTKKPHCILQYSEKQLEKKHLQYMSVCNLFEKDPKQLLSKLPCQFHILKLLGLFRECSPCWKAHCSWHHWQLATFSTRKKNTITTVTYQLQNVNMFLWHMKFLLLSDPNNHQVAPNQRSIRAFSFNLENLWKFPKTLGFFYQEVTVFPVPSLPEMHLKDLYWPELVEISQRTGQIQK